MREINRILVIGAGIMGHGFAQVFAVNGLHVDLVDRAEDILIRARQWIRENLDHMVELGEIGADCASDAIDRIYYTVHLDAPARRADYVLEAVTEDLEIKKALFRRLDRLAPSDVVLATNTSSFDINEFTKVVTRPHRVIGTHWFHPPHITPCVEVIPAEETSQETIDTVLSLMERIGKFPTLCKSAPGFVANRIQLAMAAEALAIVEEGLASPQEVDRIVKSSFGFRLSAYGPLEICDQAGLDTYQAIYHYLYGKLRREQFRPPQILRDYVAQGFYGLKSGKGFYEYESGGADAFKRQRDRRLFARLRIFKEEMKS